MTARRIGPGTAIDQGRPIGFDFDGQAYAGFAGDTLASALLANGVRVVGRSVLRGRPRGVTSAGPEEPTAIIQVDAPFPEPMLTATTVELREGLAASSISGQGRLADRPDPASYDAIHHHCDVAVVGAGPAGLAAALAAGRSGVRVLLLDDRPTPGGALLLPAEVEWSREVVAELDTLPNVVHLQRTSVAGHYDENYLIAVQRRTDNPDQGLPVTATRERVWRIRAGHVVLATGAHERSIAFAGNDAPGVMLAESVRVYLHRYGVLVGESVVVFTEHDDAYQVAVDLTEAGAAVTVVDPRPEAMPDYRGERIHGVIASTDTDPEGALTSVRVQPAQGPVTTISADILAVSGGWNPAVHLFSHSGGTLRFSPQVGAFVPDITRQNVTVVGAANGLRTNAECVTSGAIAGGAEALPPPPDTLEVGTDRPAGLYAVIGHADPAALTEHYVDVQRDVTVADITRASGAGLVSVEHVKRYTTAGTAHDQGKTSGIVTSAVLAAIQGVEIGELGVTTYRPPYTAISFAALAGRERGDLYDPIRTTGAHRWHVEHGAAWENVGQWKRPWYYPLPGEDLHAAVARECAAARTNVAFMDGSTLGKIDVQGPDAGQFLDLLYTNMISTLKVGSIRYGAMCTADGMMLDDGTVFRLTDDRFMLTTTTGNAAKILDWMEEWLQTEWPHLQVTCTSVTEQYATMALVGPRSRALLSALVPALATSAEDFPFMTWRTASIGGLAAWISRISFSGELAYEINVPWYDAAALWDLVWAAGEPIGLTPYGTETMHVLRAEKGYPIIGQDTDGTVTPQDLGMSWTVSKKKPDYIGKRSHQRADNLRPDRKHLVGLLPVDPAVLLPEGAQIIGTADVPAPPVPMLGHVTSSYPSVVLRSTFALALLIGGRDRVGSIVYVVIDGVPVPATVTSSVLVDPDGLRRDGDPSGDGPPVDAASRRAGLPISPLAPYAPAFAELSRGAALVIAEEPLSAELNLRVRRKTAAAQAIEDVIGVQLPSRTGGVSGSGDWELIALGPDEFLVHSRDRSAGVLESDLRSAVGAEATGLTDVSASRTVVRLSGTAALRVLSHGCALDLESMSPGTAAQTMLAQCAVLLIVDDPGQVRVFVRSSFAGHLASWLLVTAAEYAVPV